MNHEEMLGMFGQTRRIASDAETWSHQVALLARNATEALREVERLRNIIAELLPACEAAEAEIDASGATSTETLERLRAAINAARGD